MVKVLLPLPSGVGTSLALRAASHLAARTFADTMADRRVGACEVLLLAAVGLVGHL